MVRLSSLLSLAACCLSPALAAFGVTSSSSSYVIDSGDSDGFVVTVSRSDCSITSIKFRSTEYQYSSTSSHIASGLGSATVSYTIVSSTYVKVTCVADNSDFDLTHYYVIPSGESIIYMATNINSEPSVGELRYIARLSNSLLPIEYPYGVVSTTSGGTAIEGSDVFQVGSQTRSKFYSSSRFIDQTVYCVTDSGATVHACMVAHPSRSYEKSSGGPFFRDINTNNNGDYSAVTWYMNSGHVQTESYRTGLHGPYALSFSRSGIPKSSELDWDAFSSLSISGYVADSSRGYVTGTASGLQTGHDSYVGTVHWYNSNYQYWTSVSSSNTYTSPAMVSGSYTMVLYQGELQVASQSVSVSSGSTTTKNIAASSSITTSSHTTVFKIGLWDGQPLAFRNAANQLRMHPSDSRMSDWGPLTFTWGTSSSSDFPMALFKDVNSPVTIKFSLSSAVSSSATLRIGTTLSFAGGRPSVDVNGYTQSFSAPTNLNSRGVTRGAYRGLGEVYDATIPSGYLVSGTNTITISVISGSSGDDFLSPNFIFDCVELFY